MLDPSVGQMIWSGDVMGLIDDLTQQPPRILPWGCVLTSVGCGWVEEWIAADPEEDLPERKELQVCAWAFGHVVTVDGPFLVSYMSDNYNQRHGGRIWTDKPSEEQREAVKWE